MNREREHYGQVDHEPIVFDFESGLISQYQEHKAKADELGRKIVNNSLLLKELYIGFVMSNLGEEDIVQNHMHPRKKHSHGVGSPRKYTQIQKAMWAGDNDQAREVMYSRTSSGKKVQGESITVKDPKKPHDKLYLNLTNNTFELHEGRVFQVLAIVENAPHIAQHVPGRHEHVSDILDVLRDELGELTKFDKVEKK